MKKSKNKVEPIKDKKKRPLRADFDTFRVNFGEELKAIAGKSKVKLVINLKYPSAVAIIETDKKGQLNYEVIINPISAEKNLEQHKDWIKSIIK